jgi:hypothetical protein
MSSLQRHIAVVTDTTANLIAQLRELDLLREQVRKAEEFYAEQSQVLIDEKDTTHHRVPTADKGRFSIGY